jgi:hypothetical protein
MGEGGGLRFTGGLVPVHFCAGYCSHLLSWPGKPISILIYQWLKFGKEFARWQHTELLNHEIPDCCFTLVHPLHTLLAFSHRAHFSPADIMAHLLPFRIIGFTLEVVFKFIGAVLMLPFKIVKAL